jgi:hypothetical protein
LLHFDIKKLGRFRRPGHRVTGDRCQDSPGAGWEYAHVAIDDHSRVAFSALYPDETGRSAGLALLQALRYYAGLGIRFCRLLMLSVETLPEAVSSIGAQAPAHQTLHTPNEWQSRSLHSGSAT